MSKLYKQYVLLKMNNPNKYFLFKSGIFFIFLDEDAKLMSKVLNLKLSALNSDILKCGFPEQSFDKYINILNDLNYDIGIINTKDNTLLSTETYIDNSKLKSIASEILDTDIDKLSISQAYDFLHKIQNETSKLFPK